MDEEKREAMAKRNYVGWRRMGERVDRKGREKWKRDRGKIGI